MERIVASWKDKMANGRIANFFRVRQVGIDDAHDCVCDEPTMRALWPQQAEQELRRFARLKVPVDSVEGG